MKTIAILTVSLLLAAPAWATQTTTPAAPAKNPAAATRKAPAPDTFGKQAPRPSVPAYRQHNSRGAKLMEQGKYGEAVKEFQQALALKQDYPEAQVNLGMGQLALKRPAEATAQFNVALKKRPKMVEAWDGLAMAQAQQGKYAEAIATERQVLKLAPGSSFAHYNIGCWQAAQGKPTEAFASLQEAVRLGYHDVAWLKTDPELKVLQKDPRWPGLVKAATKPVDYKDFKVKTVQPAKPKAAGAPKATPAKPGGSAR